MAPTLDGSGGCFNGQQDPEYVCWINMINRCYKDSGDVFGRYKIRGIKVCDRWFTYLNFLSDMGRRPGDNYGIDREDNNGDYTPSNCRWVTSSVNARNRSIVVGIPFKGISLHKVGALLIARVSFVNNTSKRTNHKTIIDALNSRDEMCERFSLPAMSKYDAVISQELINAIDIDIIKRLELLSQPERNALDINDIYEPLKAFKTKS